MTGGSDRRSPPAAVILGGALNARSCARTLRRYGIDVHLFPDAGHAVGHPDSQPHAVGHPQSQPRQERPTAGPQEWAKCLDGRSALHGAVIVPCSDHALEFVARHRDQLAASDFKPVPANDDAVTAMLDKGRTYELARQCDVPVPHTRVVTSLEEFRAAVDDFSFPCALKPVHSHRFARHFTGKAFVADSPATLERKYLAALDAGVEMLLTEIVRGADHDYFSYYTYIEDDGTPLVCVTKRKLRQYPTGFGLGTYHMTTWEPEAATLGLRFARGARLRGLVNIEFKRDARDGQLKLIECNARLTAANELIRRAGVDLARIAYDRALGRPATIPHGFREDVYEWHPLQDFRALCEYRSRGELATRQWLLSLLHLRLGIPAVDRHDVSERLAEVARRRNSSSVA